jgi:hypothetical protein
VLGAQPKKLNSEILPFLFIFHKKKDAGRKGFGGKPENLIT